MPSTHTAECSAADAHCSIVCRSADAADSLAAWAIAARTNAMPSTHTAACSAADACRCVVCRSGDATDSLAAWAAAARTSAMPCTHIAADSPADAHSFVLCRSDDGVNSLAAWAKAARAGVDAIQKYGGASAGSRTMLDALLPAVHNLEIATGDAVSRLILKQLACELSERVQSLVVQKRAG